MKSIEKFYDVSLGGFCGVLVREKQAKKLMKLLYKQNQEIKELLSSDLDQLECSDWSIAYPEGKHTSFKFYTPSNEKEKLGRINLIDKTKQVQYCENGVFISDTYNNAKDAYMEWHNKTN